MPPLSTHRRARRRSRRRLITLSACVLIVVALLVGGVTQIGRQSGPFYASVNRSFAAQATTLIKESNNTSVSLRRLMKDVQSQDRRTLQAGLDTLTAQADQEEAAAENLASPSAPGDVPGEFAAVLAERADAVHSVRSALDGLLGLGPLPIAGSPGAEVTILAPPTNVSSTQATDRIVAAGMVLVRADRSYATLRRALTRLAGHARLPASTWITATDDWQSGPIATEVELVTSSTTLEVTHRLVLRVVKVTPPALPSPTGAATPGLSVLSPTTSVLVQVVLSNLGSVDEPHASVQFQLTPQPTGTAVTITRTAGLAAAGSVSLPQASFKVKPGANYQLTVAVVLPPGQADATGTSLSEVLQIAPST
jgi:hypothetical protein